MKVETLHITAPKWSKPAQHSILISTILFKTNLRDHNYDYLITPGRTCHGVIDIDEFSWSKDGITVFGDSYAYPNICRPEWKRSIGDL